MKVYTVLKVTTTPDERNYLEIVKTAFTSLENARNLLLGLEGIQEVQENLFEMSLEDGNHLSATVIEQDLEE
jgi:hypothetical protein